PSMTLSKPSLRRVPIQSIVLRSGVVFDAGRCAVLRDGEEIPLTAREADLLHLLLQLPGLYLSRRYLVQALHLQHPHADAGERVLSHHRLEQTVSRLRRKLGEPGSHPLLLRCRREVGYGLFISPSVVPLGPSVA